MATEPNILATLPRRCTLYPGEDGYWVIECPSLPGCITQGETREKAVENMREAMALYLESMIDDRAVIPADNFEMVEVAPEPFTHHQ